MLKSIQSIRKQSESENWKELGRYFLELCSDCTCSISPPGTCLVVTHSADEEKVVGEIISALRYVESATIYFLLTGFPRLPPRVPDK